MSCCDSSPAKKKRRLLSVEETIIDKCSKLSENSGFERNGKPNTTNENENKNQTKENFDTDDTHNHNDNNNNTIERKWYRLCVNGRECKEYD